MFTAFENIFSVPLSFVFKIFICCSIFNEKVLGQQRLKILQLKSATAVRDKLGDLLFANSDRHFYAVSNC